MPLPTLDPRDACALAEVITFLCALGGGNAAAPSQAGAMHAPPPLAPYGASLWDELEEDPDRRPYVWDLEE